MKSTRRCSIRKLATILPLLLFSFGPAIAQEYHRDQMPNALFPTDLIIEHQAEIGLTEEQMLAVSNLVEKLQTEIAAIHEEVSQESEKLKELLAPSMIEEQRALVSIDKLLDLSRREQKSQLLHLIRLKNTLTESQQDRLKEIRSENR